MSTYSLPYPTSCIPDGGEFGNWGSDRKSMGLGPHRGVDFSAYHVHRLGLSLDIPSAGDGTVVLSEHTSILGNVIVVRHSDGWYTGYCHLNSRAVGVGSRVKRRQKLGVMGETGSAASAVHLHHTLSQSAEGVYEGVVHNPVPFEQSHSNPVSKKPGRTLATLSTGVPNTAFNKRLQWYGHLNGYSGPIDGRLGQQSWMGIQTGLKHYGYTGLIDGKVGPLTRKALQEMAHQYGSKDSVDGTISASDYRAIAKRLNIL